jgi:hypothetical protein
MSRKRLLGDPIGPDDYIQENGPVPYVAQSVFARKKKSRSVNNTPTEGNNMFGVNDTDYNRDINTDPVGGRRRKTRRRKSKKSKRRRRSRRR